MDGRGMLFVELVSLVGYYYECVRVLVGLGWNGHGIPRVLCRDTPRNDEKGAREPKLVTLGRQND